MKPESKPRSNPQSAPRVCYKLTTQARTTYSNFQWIPRKWYETSGQGELSGPGFFHAYSDPLVALFLNSTHANIENPILWEARGAGAFLDDNGLKCGFSRMRLVKRLPIPEITSVQRAAFAILCALAVPQSKAFSRWAEAWLSGEDRSARAAYAANAATRTACADAYATYADAAYAAYAAAYAAYAAARAAAYAATKGSQIDFPAIARRAMEIK